MADVFYKHKNESNIFITTTTLVTKHKFFSCILRYSKRGKREYIQMILVQYSFAILARNEHPKLIKG